jgi:hypothetical protein
MKKLITLIALLLVACTDEAATVRTLEAHGFSEVETTGYEYLGCSEGLDASQYVGTFQLRGGALVFHLFAEFT